MKHFLRAFALVLAALLSAPAHAGEFRQISQIINSSGNPVVNGYIYIGTYGLDPVTNPISLFSDSALSVPIANPVRTDSYGRPTTDIYFSQSQYSYTLKTSALVTIEGPKNRDAVPTAASVASNQASTATSCGTFTGTNTLTCTLSPAIAAYTDIMAVRGRIANDNTGAVTLNLNGVGAKNVVKVDGTALVAGDLQQNDTITVAFDSTNNRFQLQSPNAALTRNGNNAPARADVASAGTVDLDAVVTNYVRITGTTTITAITLTDGRVRDVVFGGALTLTNGASLILPGGASIKTAAGDAMRVRGESGGAVRVVGYTKASGVPLAIGAITRLATTSGTTVDFTGIPAAAKRVTINFEAVSTNGTSPVIVQMGDSGGAENIGYTGEVATLTTAANTITSFSGGGFALSGSWAATSQAYGSVVLTLSNSAANQWCMTGSVSKNSSVGSLGGCKATTDALDRIRLTTITGADTFDAGAASILVE